jgi:hypothetical protein
LLGGLESDAWSLTLLDELAVARTDTSLELIDFANPANPAGLPIDADLACISFDSSRVSGSIATGVWLPAGDLGSIRLYKR